MNRNAQYYRDKQILALHRERRALWPRQQQTVEIDPPIPRGWVRHWRLTERAKKRHDVGILQTILPEIDNKRHCWRKDFKPAKRRRHKMINHDQPLLAIRDWRWQRLGWPEDWKIHFRKIRINVGRHDETDAYQFLREDLFELFTERNYIRRLRVLDPAAKSREAEIEQYLTYNGFNHRLDWLLGNHWRRGPDPRQQILDRLATQRLRKAREGDLEAEARRKSPLSSLLPQVTPHSSCSCSPTSRDTTSRASPVRVRVPL